MDRTRRRLSGVCLDKLETGRELFTAKFGKPIEEFDAFKRATEGLDETTFKLYRRILPYYFLYLDQNPDQVIEQRKSDLRGDDTDMEFYERKTKAFAKDCLRRGLAGGSVTGNIGRVQGFFANNGRRLSLDLQNMKIPKARKRRKYSPSIDDVKRLKSVADCARDHFVLTLMYQSGTDPKDVSLLRDGDVPLEPWVLVERSRSKTGEIWRLVTTPDICESLKAYLTVRGPSRTGHIVLGREGPLRSAGISQIIRELMTRSGLTSVPGFKPTSLRDSFEDACVDANIAAKCKKALMGHTTDIENQYGGYNKMVEALVSAAKKVYPYLCLSKPQDDKLEGITHEDVMMLKDYIRWIKEGKFKPSL